MTNPRSDAGWHGKVRLRFDAVPGSLGSVTRHQGKATAPLKLQRAFAQEDGRCELPLLHTAGGLVGGDRLSLQARLGAGSRALLTSVAAQKVYGSIGRSRQAPQGLWARQELTLTLTPGADLEWLPQELVLYEGALYEQQCRVLLAPGASYLGAEVVRLGRTAAGEGLGAGRWRSALEVVRSAGDEAAPAGVADVSGAAGGSDWELVDRLELGGDTLHSLHGLAGEPVFGSLVWAAPAPLPPPAMASLLAACRDDRRGLEGTMACGALRQGLVARYRGPSSQAARFWFTRLWARIRAVRNLPPPQLPRVWPFQETPWL